MIIHLRNFPSLFWSKLRRPYYSVLCEYVHGFKFINMCITYPYKEAYMLQRKEVNAY